MKQKSVNAVRVFNSRFTSTISISLVLFLLGIMLTLGFLAKHLSDYVKENVCMSVVVDDGLRVPDAKMFQQKLEAMPWTKSVTYIDKETALKELIEELGENPEDLLGFNPTLASFEVYLNAGYANADSMAVAEAYLKRFKNVQDVIYRKDLVHMVNENVRRISVILLILASLLTMISYSLIRNTVKLLIYSKRFLIRTMQLVGAGRGFILKPFILQNLVSAAIASCLSMGYLYGSLMYLDKQIPGSLAALQPGMMALIFLIVLVFGSIIMTIATLLAVNRYLKMNTGDLYFV